MSRARRVLLLVGSTCAFLVCAEALALALRVSAAGEAASFVLGSSPLRALAALVAVAAFVCAATMLVRAIVLVARSSARISDKDQGQVTIEKTALVSVVRRALERVAGVSVHRVDVDVMRRGGTAVMYVSVKASPLTDDSLMQLAAQIQQAAGDALRHFTEHEVRYVAVNFVEGRRRADAPAAPEDDPHAEEAARRDDAVKNSPGSAARTEGGEASEAQGRVAPPAVAQPAALAADDTVERTQARLGALDQDGTEYETVVEEPKGFWAARKERRARARAEKEAARAGSAAEQVGQGDPAPAADPASAPSGEVDALSGADPDRDAQPQGVRRCGGASDDGTAESADTPAGPENDGGSPAPGTAGAGHVECGVEAQPEGTSQAKVADDEENQR